MEFQSQITFCNGLHLRNIFIVNYENENIENAHLYVPFHTYLCDEVEMNITIVLPSPWNKVVGKKSW